MVLSRSCRRLPRPAPGALRTLSQLNDALRRHAPLDIHPEVEDALATNKPVVALETAVVTNGMPYPDNLELATSLENIVRSTGSVPATIGLIDGRVKIGMERNHLETLADTARSNPVKISRRDIAPAIAMKVHGGTTCSATLIFAAMAGIKVFATGGLGGVHRGGQDSMDVSADLHELTRCPVGLVSSGVKSILDIGRTLEYLETLGVPVVTYGGSRRFPAFFSRDSGFDAPWNVNDPSTTAKILHTQWQLGFQNGALISVPIPAEFEEAGRSIQNVVDQAVAESEVNGVSKRGKEATPWLLARVLELTNGSSLTSNIALLRNTAFIGGKIAVEYQKLATSIEDASIPTVEHPVLQHLPNRENCAASSTTADLMVIGSAAIDITAKPRPETDGALANYSTAPGTVSMSLGGVARNIAEAAHRVISRLSPSTSPCVLVSPIGDDAFGRTLLDETVQLGMRVDGLIKTREATAVCNMILNEDGGLVGGVADMDITAKLTGDTVISKIQAYNPRLVALDGNSNSSSISSIVSHCIRHDIQVFFEPTSIIKSTAILPAIAASLDVPIGRAPITFASPNVLELIHLERASRDGPLELSLHPVWWRVIDDLNLGSTFRRDLEVLAKMPIVEGDSVRGTLAFLVDQGIVQMAVRLLPFFQHLIIKCGERGVTVVMRISPNSVSSAWEDKSSGLNRRCVVARGNSNETVVVQHFPPLAVSKVINVTGAGDSFVGALLASLLQNSEVLQDPRTLSDAIFTAQTAAILTLQSHNAVSPLLSDFTINGSS